MRATAAALAVVVGIALEPSAHGESRLAAFERGPDTPGGRPQQRAHHGEHRGAGLPGTR